MPDSYAYADSNPHLNSNGNCHNNCDGNCDSFSYCYAYSNIDSYTYFDAETFTNAETGANAQAASHAPTAPITCFMKKNTNAQSGLINLRTLASMLVCAAAMCSMIVTGTLLAFWRSDAKRPLP